MKKIQLPIILFLMTLASSASAGVNSSLSYSTDYLFRGISQMDGLAFSGHLEFDHNSGLYAGVWASEVDYIDGSDIEHDLYAGWKGSIFGLDTNFSYIDYNYNGNDNLDGSEIMLSTEFSDFSIAYYIGQKDYKDYLEFGYSNWGLDFSYGIWEDIGRNWSVSKSFDLFLGFEGSFSYIDFSADKVSEMVNEDSLMFSISKSF